MAAIKPSIVQNHGRCYNAAKHEAHTFQNAEYETHISLWDCPGQHSDCANCDDRKCMSCVFREVHEICKDSCPGCCA